MNTSISKTATSSDAFLEPALFYRSARDGMQDFLTNSLKSPDDGVLLPAYIGWSQREGSGVFDPIRNLGARHGFYGLNADLTVDLEELERRIVADSYRVLLVIHYFGRTDPNIAVIRNIADRRGVLLVEDLAHGFFSARRGGTAGRYGHVRLFSLHKMFPFADGGMVTYEAPSFVTGQKGNAPELAAQLLSYNWSMIAKARRRNFLILSERLCALPECGNAFVLLWPELDEYDTPQTLPVRILKANRDQIYEHMNSEGFGMVSLYHTLIDEVRSEFDDLMELSHQIINFPVHQDITLAALDEMVLTFQRSLGWK